MEKVEDFLIIDNLESKVVFSTAERNRSFNRNTEEGIKELESIKETFNVSEVLYLKQVHSDIVKIYDGQNDFNDNEGDAIITNKKNVVIGAFTADCVPVILVNEEKNTIAAIHSGWKGTFNSITKKTLKVMEEEFSCNHCKTKAYIGPHIMDCCYEISEELKERFKEEKKDVSNLFIGRNLNMQNCILSDLKSEGVLNENIIAINKCTYCNEDVKLHSYRKSNGSYGRLFTFVFLK